MTACAIFSLVMAGVGSAFIGVIRMSKTAMAEAELSLRMRQLREKLLFRVEPSHDGKIYAGLLSADHGVEQGVRVRASGEGFDVVTGGRAEQTVKVVADSSGMYLNEGDGTGVSRNNRWLNPTGIAVTHRDGFGWSDQDSTRLYTLDLEATAAGVTRRERVVVPIFGAAQVKNSESVFHD